MSPSLRLPTSLFVLFLLITNGTMARAGSDVLDQRVKALLHSAKNASSPEQQKAVVKDCLSAIDMAVSEDDYSAAAKLAAVGLESATKSGNLHLQVVCKRRKDEVAQYSKEFRKLSKATDKLAAGKLDKQSALDLGQFYGLVVGDWQRGRPLLQRSSGDWSKVADAEESDPKEISQQMAIGAAWARLAAGEKPPYKRGAQARAYFWYRQSLESSIGDTRAQVSQAMDDLPFRYLTDLDELDVQPGPWPLGKYGTNGVSAPIRVNGIPAPYGLGLHPPNSGGASVKYRLDGKYKTFSTGAALNDSEVGFASVIVFSVIGDGKLLWKSQPFKTHEVADFCDISVKGVKQLELRTECQGFSNWGHACWLDPVLGK